MSEFNLGDLNNKNKIVQKNAIDYYSSNISPEDSSKLANLFDQNPKSELGLIYSVILGRNGNKDVIDKLILYLQNKNYSLQRQAELALINIGKHAVEPLIKATAIDDKTLLMRISRVIRNMEDMNVPLMLKMIESGTTPMKVIAVYVLGKVRNDDKIIISLVKALANDEPDLDLLVIDSLVENGESVLPMIQKVFKNCNDRIAGILMEVLYRIGKPAMKILMECLDSPTLSLRRHAPYALRFANDVETIKKIIAALNDSDYYVCESAYKYLCHNLEEATYTIVKMLDDSALAVEMKKPENAIAENQMHWLIKSLCKDFEKNSEHVLIYMKNPEELKNRQQPIPQNLKISLACAVTTYMNTVMVSRLIKMLGDESYFVRENALTLLIEYGKPFVPEIIMALGDPKEDVRDGLIRVLKSIKSVAFSVLLENLRLGNNEMRYNSAYALGFMEDKAAVEPLKASLIDGNDWVREYAIMSLGKLGEYEALIAQLPRATDQTKAQVSKALGYCGAPAIDSLVNALRAAPVDKREPFAKAIMAVGEAGKSRIQAVLETEDNENVRFWLVKVTRSYEKKPSL